MRANSRHSHIGAGSGGVQYCTTASASTNATEQVGGLLLPGQSPLLSVFIVFVLVLFLRPQGLFGRSG